MAFNFNQRIAQILNWSPFLHVSEDSSFGSIVNLVSIRLSLLAIPLGNNKFYLLSFVKNGVNKWEFEIYKCLKFYDVCKNEDQSQIDIKTESYKNLIATHEDEKIRFQIDLLKDKLNQNQNRKSTVYNKLNNYAAIALVYIGFIGYLFTELLSIKINNIYFKNSYWLIFAFLILLSFNFFSFVQFGLSIKAFVRSKFSDLKNDPTEKQLALSYYTDWYSSKNEADIISSIICNIEEYFKRSLVITILLWLCIVINNNLTSKTFSKIISHENQYLIVNDSNEFLINEFSNFLENINKNSNNIYIISKKRKS